MTPEDKEDPVRESIGYILGIVALVLFIFLAFHGGELAEIVMNQLR